MAVSGTYRQELAELIGLPKKNAMREADSVAYLAKVTAMTDAEALAELDDPEVLYKALKMSDRMSYSDWYTQFRAGQLILPPPMTGWTVKQMSVDWGDYWWVEAGDVSTLTLTGAMMAEIEMALRYSPDMASDGTWEQAVAKLSDGAHALLMDWVAKAENTTHGIG
eukprot:3405663-Amphidinium_carterae.1